MSFSDDTYCDEEAIGQAIELYKWGGAVGSFQWIDRESLREVCKYLRLWEGLFYWRIILAGGVPGYSLFLHERVEMMSYIESGNNPFDREQQQLGYCKMHAKALLMEHRFLQSVAQVMGYSFSLRELIVYNPHGEGAEGGWDGDWEVLANQLPEQLSDRDQSLNPNRESEIRSFYRELGFEKEV